MNKFIKLTGRKFHDEILFAVEKIGVMFEVGAVVDHSITEEDAYTVITCDGAVYKVLESKEEIMERIGGVVV